MGGFIEEHPWEAEAQEVEALVAEAQEAALEEEGAAPPRRASARALDKRAGLDQDDKALEVAAAQRCKS